MVIKKTVMKLIITVPFAIYMYYLRFIFFETNSITSVFFI
nr:MAG TPA: hypothetical protein [Caudoviricetes sp.]